MEEREGKGNWVTKEMERKGKARKVKISKEG